MKFLIILMCVMSANTFATDVFKCVDANGNQLFSDIPCAEGTQKEKIVSKEYTWVEEVKARKPVNTNILTVKKGGTATEFEYQFSNRKELTEFMSLVGKISGRNVYLLQVKNSTNIEQGFALIKVTSKGNNLFGKDKP